MPSSSVKALQLLWYKSKHEANYFEPPCLSDWDKVVGDKTCKHVWEAPLKMRVDMGKVWISLK